MLKNNNSYVISNYTLGNTLNLKIAILADLHETNPIEIVKILKKEMPNIILCPGDIFERHSIDRESNQAHRKDLSLLESLFFKSSILFSRFLNTFPFLRLRDEQKIEYGYLFIQEISKIAPMYLSVGNHETFYTQNDLSIIENSGVTLLDNNDCEIYINNILIRIGGLSSYANYSWLNEYSTKDGIKLLMCHHPEYYPKILKNINKKENISLIVSGHVHGGQWKIFGKPLFSPTEGLFPKYGYGNINNHMIVSGGLSNTVNIPRLFNPREIVFVNL